MNDMKRMFAAALIGGTVLAVSGCASMGGFGGERSLASAQPASETTQTGALPLKPATYVIDTTETPPRDVPGARAPGKPATTAVATPAAYPNLSVPPPAPKSKVLTPEEKAKVIAELEALAKSQEAAVDKTRKTDGAKCDDAVQKSLDPEAKLKSEVAGQGC